MDLYDKRIINQLQGGFPLCERPFQAVAAHLELSEAELIVRLRALLAQQVLTRFGPLYHAERLGGVAWLAAVAAPEAELERIAAIINAQVEVAHHYQRTHRLNLWFVVTAESVATAEAALERIERLTGQPVYRFPKEREYFVELKLPVIEDVAAVRPAPLSLTLRTVTPAPEIIQPLDPVERRVMHATQAGLPLVSQPYHALAASLELTPDAVLEALTQMLARGAIRRIGAVPNQYALGYRANGMSVWDVSDSTVDQHGAAIARLPCVSHCYRRPRCLPLWPYNLFVMLHGATRSEVSGYAQHIQALLGGDCRQSQVLYSTRMFKKTGLRSPRPEETPCSV